MPTKRIFSLLNAWTTPFVAWILLTSAAALCLAPAAVAQHYRQTNLVSDIPNLAAATDRGRLAVVRVERGRIAIAERAR